MTRTKLVLVNNYKDKDKGQKALHNITKCTGQPVEIVERNGRGLQEKLAELEPTLVFLSGSEYLLTKPGTREAFREEIELVKSASYPILGICFGHQLIGTAFGSGMSELGETIRRFEPVNILDHNTLFKGLPPTITVAESHRQALDRVPDRFLRLAESTTSSIEAVCHETLPIYGLQFHPEKADEDHPHGRTIIRNMVEMSERA